MPPLRAVREAQGLTLRQAARLADVDPSQLSKAERGIGSLSVSQLARLAHVLGLRHLARQLDRYAGPMP
ncbi:MAG: helix-turn-helix transcriptional regulator [Chloroflexota bacterium]